MDDSANFFYWVFTHPGIAIPEEMLGIIAGWISEE